MSTNLGKAKVKVELLNTLPYVTKDAFKYDFDISAHQWGMLQVSPQVPPQLLDCTTDEYGFAVIYPTKRKYYIDNYITDKDGQTLSNIDTSKPYILFKPISNADGLMLDMIEEEGFPEYTLMYPKSYPSTAGVYNGPKWDDDARDRESMPNDFAWINRLLNTLATGEDQESTTTTTTESSTEPLPKVNYINQTVVRDGLWWGVESSSFLYENMPFWITIDRANSPSSSDFSTFFLISLGIDSAHNAFDIFLSNDAKPIITDYIAGRENIKNKDEKVPFKTKQFDDDLSKLLSSESHIEIGIMTIGSRLVVFVNKNVLMYMRVDEEGKQYPLKIDPGKIRIYGTNAQVAINVSPMTFAPLGFFAPPIPIVPEIREGETDFRPKWGYVDYQGNVHEGPVCILPREPSMVGTHYGVDCLNFYSDSGDAKPTGDFFHSRGNIWLYTASQLGFNVEENTDYYICFLQPSHSTMEIDNKSYVIPFSGCPYFYRIKGGFSYEPDPPATNTTDISDDVISVSESFQTDDYFFVSGSATVTLYNKEGKYDFLREVQKGISIYWGWDSASVKTFTGIVLNSSISETPGNEQITLTCHDYCFILKNYVILNSPFYDGMVAFYAIKDILGRAGILNPINEWTDTNDYFLPAGYTYTKPAMRFPDNQSIYDCAKSIAEREEAVIYFDQNGRCRIKRLPGGLLSSVSDEPIIADFVRNPSASPSNVIIDTKTIEYFLDDTANRIVIVSLDRDTRNIILYNKSAESNADRLVYRRIAYEDQPALGKFETVVARADQLAQRIFYPIRQTSFKTIGTEGILKALDLITIDGSEHRLTSISRKYDATNNDLTCDYNAEWLGGI